MMRFLVTVLVVFGVWFAAAGGVGANEGIAELANIEGGSSRCWMVSILLQSYNYRVVMSCRNLLYPAIEAEVFDYALWVVPDNPKVQPQKLGMIGVGKAEFDTRDRFTGVFVTKEVQRTGADRDKPGPVIMQGSVRPIKFLESGIAEPTLVPTAVVSPTAKPGGQTANPVEGLSKSVQTGTVILKIAGVALLLGLGIIIVVILASGLAGKRNVPPPGM